MRKLISILAVAALLLEAAPSKAIQSELVVGPQQSFDGNVLTSRAGRFGQQFTADFLPRYYEATVRGFVFTASNVGAQAVSVALATTYTGLCLSNPIGSGKNFILIGGQYALTVAPAAIASLHLIAGGNTSNVTHTTPLAAPGIQSALIGQNAGTGTSAVGTVARVDSAATIANPYYLAGLGSGFTAAALYATTPLQIDFGGMFVIGPGGYVAWGALTAVTGFGSFVWIEVPQ